MFRIFLLFTFMLTGAGFFNSAEASAELDWIKTLVGNWKGTYKMGDKVTPAEAEYSLTAGGNAVLERLFPGTPHEMATTYYDMDGKLFATHYCSVGNRPVMQGVGLSETSVGLHHVSGLDDIVEEADGHMHGLKLTSEAPDTLQQTWLFYEGGKPSGVTIIDLKKDSEPKVAKETKDPKDSKNLKKSKLV